MIFTLSQGQFEISLPIVDKVIAFLDYEVKMRRLLRPIVGASAIARLAGVY